MLHRCLKDAEAAHVIARNPTDGAVVPKANHRPKQILTKEQIDTFLAAVDQMSEWAFHDACTGCNPVYPTIGELKACYLRAFYGNEKFMEKYGDVLEVEVHLPAETHAAYPLGLSAEIGVDKVGGFI